MLKKKYRLGRPAIFKNSHIINSQFFTLRVVKNNLLYNRYGFVVSKKVDKRATVRNKLKRQASSCIENMVDKIKRGHDILLVIKKPAVEVDGSLCLKVKDILSKEGFIL